MVTSKCVFCGKEQEDYKGVYLAKNDGTMNYYSSGKCMKSHLKYKRDKRKFRWTEAFHVVRKKRAAKAKVLAEKVKKVEKKEVKKEK